MVFWVALLTWLSAPISYLSGGQVGHYRLVTSALYIDPFIRLTGPLSLTTMDSGV